MGMDLEYAPELPQPQRPRLIRRIFAEIGRRILLTYAYDTTLWRTALAGPWIIGTLAFIIAVLGIPTGMGAPADIILAAGAGTLVLALAGNLLALLLSLTGLRFPKLFAGTVLGSFGAVLLILYFSDLTIEAAAAVAGIAALLGVAAGLSAGLLRSRRTVPGVLLAAVLLLAPLPLYGAGPMQPPEHTITAEAGDAAPISAADPGATGSYSYEHFAYGSGDDLHRAAYGSEVRLTSGSADASAYIKNWPKLRTIFWGFDYTALPLNAQVWMPEGAGPFPLVLMVHGNHMMEDYSEEGYAYLGELLASRGFIAVTLDENFLNYSAWSGIPDNDFKVRTWMILKHLEQIGEYAEQPDNPFYRKVDYTKTALLGHSRGGQAVAMAADAARWFKDDPVLAAAGQFTISSVIALAPTDKAIDDQQARLKDVNYLALQGARDGDVHDFYGDRQYIRSSYSSGSSAFKSSLYIADANHSQFNTDWGLYDQSLPAGLFLSRAQIMDGDEQRQIAKVYVSAFLETTLHGQTAYKELFRDYRSGLQWLPDTAYFSRFQSGEYIPVASYDEDRNKNTVTGGTAAVTGLGWTEETAKDRESKSKATYGILLEHDAGEEAGSYSILLKDSVVRELAASGAEGLTFSMANRNADTGEEDSEPDVPAAAAPAPDVEIELTDSNEVSARLPLDEVMDILPLPQTEFTISPWLEERVSGGKYGDLSEAVFQTYELPFESFLTEEPALNPDELTEITFYLQEEGDRIMLDDIGFYTGNGSPGGLQ
ncbi:poly(ethylene terephthalate) hydrolase family protein [Paenibacillus typhae]|uniref:poly(ethylene terephthalate) hydrolase family protein n=1 Tax=Paenibacillus typhae TaxID=1174501 RepID=UPI001C8EF477|nr:alpha/beta hydrolase [Paenibacillus typhae]MBY0013766.1 alpha/beta hydrolase [Paenibacillus typhae]